jgi:uncharacterized protein (DUF488 family)
MTEGSVRIFTIGHSTREPAAFLSILREFAVGVIADVRRYPSSRRLPHFNRKILQELLSQQNIGYVWLEALGGHRHGLENRVSPNRGLRNPGFRNYADHMLTEEFREGVSQLMAIAVEKPCAILCAERLYWKCHRRLLSDFLTARGAEVMHILEAGKAQPHRLTAGAVLTKDRNVIYPAQPVLDFEG